MRALARQLSTSHQLLQHYLDGIEKWRYMERYRKAQQESDQILARAILEDRPLTLWEEERRHDCTIAGVRAKVGAFLQDQFKKFKQEVRHGPLDPAQLKMAKIFAKEGFPGARELLQKCLQVGVKKRKPFAEIVKETPRQEGETSISWVRRIWDECDKYVTKCPTVITEELLEKCSQSGTKSPTDNLPVSPAHAAKSFRCEQR